MDTKKALLIQGESVFDISDKVQMISANDKDTGELKYRGNGIVVYRPNHINGNAIVFLNYRYKKRIFGELACIYTISKSWSAGAYANFNMLASDDDLLVIDSIEGLTSL